MTWDDLAFLREHWDGPIALKGIQHTDDARRAVDAGMDGIVVSNHGGRQVDGAIASLDALPAITHAVGDQIDVLFDSGIRTGADVVKALALGAKAVLLARPYAYGLALGGGGGRTARAALPAGRPGAHAAAVRPRRRVLAVPGDPAERDLQNVS